MPKATQTVLEIDLDALGQNYRYLTSKLQNGTKVMAVVKAFGYGSDSVAVAKELVDLGVDYFAVAYSAEGERLRDAGIETPVLVLHPMPENFKLIIDRCLEPAIYSFRVLEQFILLSEKLGQKEYPIHLKFNTGLNRLGFSENDVSKIVEILAKTQSVKVKSAFSHLAASEDKNEIEFTKKQINTFKNISEKLIGLLKYKPLLHTVNTSGILNYPEAHLDMVRTGIGLYGFGNNTDENKNLKPIATLKTLISQIHTVEAGETVGYNRAFKAVSQFKTATLPIGHADGISRAYGNGKGWVTINNQKAPIVGNVCMDMIMIDVTNIRCQEGDEVIVFGENPTAEALAAAIGSIPYELITALSQRVKRVIIKKVPVK